MNWYINNKTGELVQVKYIGNLEYEITGEKKILHKKYFDEQYSEAMICPNTENGRCKNDGMECDATKPHIMCDYCNGDFEGCVPCILYTGEQEEKIQPAKQTADLLTQEDVDKKAGELLHHVNSNSSNNSDSSFDTWHETEVICPWCGYKHRDSWEMDTGDYDCMSCEKPFSMEREIEVYYTTSKSEVEDNGE